MSNHETTLAHYLIALADDELILGHRDSEWSGHAPILEEDIAFANIALDEIGHAVMYYETASELLGEDRDKYPDRLAYFRDAQEYRCIQMVELPKGDWAFTIVRQYLYDVAEFVRMAALAEVTHQPTQAVAVKVRGEEMYHLRHALLWLKRLGLGTEESSRRMQTALDALWPYALQMFAPLPGEEDLVEAYNFPHSADLRTTWEERVRPVLAEANLTPPEDASPPTLDRSVHTEHLTELLTEMQKVARLDPNATW